MRSRLREPKSTASIGGRVRLYGHPKAPTLREAFGVLLAEWPWELYLTWTFDERVGEVKAAHEIRQHVSFIEWAMRREIGWMFGLEQEYGADRPHGHGLICGAERLIEEMELYKDKPHERRTLRIEPYWLAWKDRNGAGRFEIVKGREDVSFYCAKYAGKRGEIFLSDNLGRFRRWRRPGFTEDPFQGG